VGKSPDERHDFFSRGPKFHWLLAPHGRGAGVSRVGRTIVRWLFSAKLSAHALWLLGSAERIALQTA
jgi:hypothetical protein